MRNAHHPHAFYQDSAGVHLLDSHFDAKVAGTIRLVELQERQRRQDEWNVGNRDVASAVHPNYKELPSVLLPYILANDHAGENTLASVKTIYVGSMGQSDESERFRILLEGELTKAGFTSVDASQKADGILTGALAVRVYANDSIARATVVLKTPDGKHLWGKDFQPHRNFWAIDDVKLRAQDVAKTLRKDVVSAAKHK